MEWLVITLASLFAGFVDSIVGGGGLILVPALFSVFPGASPATLFGTNKSASVWGTAAATVQLSRRVHMRWHALLPAAGYLVMHALESQLFTPLVLGRTMRINPLAIILWLLLWGWLWGVAGLLVAVPMLVCLKIVAERLEGGAPWARLLE